MNCLVHVPKRENVIVNRLNKTKKEREVNFEQELVDRQKRIRNENRAAAAKKACHCYAYKWMVRCLVR